MKFEKFEVLEILQVTIFTFKSTQAQNSLQFIMIEKLVLIAIMK